MSYCHEKGLFCEFARVSGYCTSTGCNKLTTVTYEIRTMTPATNADHIRSLTDEELADYLAPAFSCYRCPARNYCEKDEAGTDCNELVANWLKHPYGGDT